MAKNKIFSGESFDTNAELKEMLKLLKSKRSALKRSFYGNQLIMAERILDTQIRTVTKHINDGMSAQEFQSFIYDFQKIKGRSNVGSIKSHFADVSNRVREGAKESNVGSRGFRTLSGSLAQNLYATIMENSTDPDAIRSEFDSDEVFEGAMSLSEQGKSTYSSQEIREILQDVRKDSSRFAQVEQDNPNQDFSSLINPF